MSHNGDWYDSPECEALTRELVEFVAARVGGDGVIGLDHYGSIPNENWLAVQMGADAYRYANKNAAFMRINPVLAARLIKERING